MPLSCEHFIRYIRKYDGKAISDAEDLELVISMFSLLEYSSNYSETKCLLWFYFKYETTNFNNDTADTNDFEYSKYKTKLLGEIEADGANNLLKKTIFVTLKYLSNFWRSLKRQLINWKVQWKLKWTNHCVLYANGKVNDAANSSNTIFPIKDTKLHALVVTLSVKDNQKLLKLLRKRPEILVYWNDYKTKRKSEIHQISIYIFLNQIW